MLITKKYLIQKYIREKCSTIDIAKLFKVNRGTIWYWLKKYNIKLRPRSEAVSLAYQKHPETRKKISIAMIKNRSNKKQEKVRRNKIRDTVKKQWANKSYKDMMLKIRKEQWTKELRLRVSGKNSHLWKGGKSFEPYPIGWNNVLKESIRIRDNYICQICKISEYKHGKKLDVHHLDNDKNNLDPTNLISLCHSCHIKTQRNTKLLKKGKRC